MKYDIDCKYLIDTFKIIADIPSVVGYSKQLNPVLASLAKDLGYTVTYDNRNTAYITVPGKKREKKIAFGAHADTIGMVVYKIENDGTIQMRTFGGVMFQSYEGESVRVITRDGREYTGLIACKSHSPHVFEDCRSMPRDQEHMVVFLDEPVKSKEDVQALGIQNGDFIYPDSRTTLTKSGYLKSRYIDDKGAIACAYAALKYIAENKLVPAYDTVFAFPYYEEKSCGGAYVPDGISEYIAIDIGLVGPDLDGAEDKVSICTADANIPYDYDLTNRLVDCAKEVGCGYALDVFYRYGTDAAAAFKMGNNLRAAAFGMAVICSHGVERTHVDGLIGTANMIIEYMLRSDKND